MKFYAVRKGLKTGIFTDWNEVDLIVKNFSGAEYKSFKEKKEAIIWMNKGLGILSSNDIFSSNDKSGKLQNEIEETDFCNEKKYTKIVGYTDGGSRGNPGTAGLGVVLYDEDNTIITKISTYLGSETNNVAEYLGCIVALKHCHKLGATNVELNLDSKLVCMQLANKWEVKAENLQDLYHTGIKWINKFESCKLNHVYRKYNKIADSLANIAMDKGESSSWEVNSFHYII